MKRRIALACVALTAAAACSAAPIRVTAGGAVSSPPAGRWRSVGSGPLGPSMLSPEMIWTGRSVIVLGQPQPTPVSDPGVEGAAFDPATGAWRRIAAAPAGVKNLIGAVWTGREVVTLGAAQGMGNADRTVAAYDPAADGWKMLPPPPVPGTAVVWTGSRVLVSVAPGARAGAMLDPATGAWSLIPPGPTADSSGYAGAVWTGHELVLEDFGPSAPGAADELFLFDPVRGTWRTSSKPPVGSMWPYIPMGVAAGGGTVALVGPRIDPSPPAGPSQAGDRCLGCVPFPGHGLAGPGVTLLYDPASDSWRQFASPRSDLVPACGPLDAGRLLYTPLTAPGNVGDAPFSVLDVGAGTWTGTMSHPAVGAAGCVVAGRSIFLYGDAAGPNRAWLWTP